MKQGKSPLFYQLEGRGGGGLGRARGGGGGGGVGRLLGGGEGRNTRLEVYGPLCFTIGMMTNTTGFYNLILSLDLQSRSEECEKAKASASIISQSFQSIWMEFGILLRLVSVMNLAPILSGLINIQGWSLLCEFII